MILEMPYFMSNKAWYEYNTKKKCYELTKEATAKAIKSYKEYYKNADKVK